MSETALQPARVGGGGHWEGDEEVGNRGNLLKCSLLEGST